MRKRITRVTVYLILLLIVLCAVGALFGFTLFFNPSGIELDLYFASPLLNTEMVWLTFALGIILLAGLIILACVAISTAVRYKRIKKAWNRLEKKRARRKGEKGIRFKMLYAIDRKYAKKSALNVKYNNDITLEELCRDFRNYAASRLGLYYSIEDIRRFIAGLGVSKLIILQGISGTGKTSLAYAIGGFLQNESTVVPVQPMWKERTDLIGYFNEFTRNFNETVLLRKMYEAGYSKDIFVTILDEVNISRIEYYFAEFLSLLELPDDQKRYLDVVSDVWQNDPLKFDNGRIKLPSNMWFIGTANNDDSTFAISNKVYDRAMVMSLDKKCTPFVAEDTPPVRVSADCFDRLIGEAKSAYSFSKEGRAKLARTDKYIFEKFGISFGNRVLKQFNEYIPIMIACGGTETGAVDDILSRKVLRKLEALNPTFVRENVDELQEFIVNTYGGKGLEQSISYLEMLKHAL